MYQSVNDRYKLPAYCNLNQKLKNQSQDHDQQEISFLKSLIFNEKETSNRVQYTPRVEYHDIENAFIIQKTKDVLLILKIQVFIINFILQWRRAFYCLLYILFYHQIKHKM